MYKPESELKNETQISFVFWDIKRITLSRIKTGPNNVTQPFSRPLETDYLIQNKDRAEH